MTNKHERGDNQPTGTIIRNQDDVFAIKRNSSTFHESSPSTSENLKILLFYMLSVMVICLTVFNFYLFCWIWSSLNGGGGLNNHWAKLDLVSYWDTIKFEGKVSSKRNFQVNQVIASNAHDSSSSLEVNDNDDERILQILSNNSTQFFAGWEKEKKLVLKINRDGIFFPHGLMVKSLESKRNKNKKKNRVLFSCESNLNQEQAPKCLIDSSLVKFSHPNGLDLGKKSIQTSKINTKLLHSPMNSLNLLSTRLGSFESSSSSIEFISLEELSLFSRSSSVTLNSTRIDISGIKNKEPTTKNSSWRKGEPEKSYKLCLCLANAQPTRSSFNQHQKQQQQNHEAARENLFNSKNVDGLVFAIRANLSCLNFDSFCNAQ